MVGFCHGGNMLGNRMICTHIQYTYILHRIAARNHVRSNILDIYNNFWQFLMASLDVESVDSVGTAS